MGTKHLPHSPRRVIGDLKEGREAADGEIPLLEYAPDSDHAQAMRDLAKELAV
ncbi:hypothetical protein [Streptomyces sp. DSM 40907]|uniref:hypothetical protein n=1 Tax=Streptomyces kutzneri TaxID=3051179 RepID=UPI0028D012AF|nr:hypothetical protein [Streptomyces sp. DSM 40907]